ncbi:hypothetical protein [uncultured Paenibacillus sp.]|uniref:hypothetical protein n=1 Tax=uncultured Paenibacillus sp. TaxID=227322 RepID=UPI0015AF1E6F|nr:hypothetical protein [uncultured Paenibacillus sp.]
MKKHVVNLVRLFAIPLFAVSLGVCGASAYAAPVEKSIDPMTESSTVTFEYIKQKALKEGKALDVNKYEATLQKMASLGSTNINNDKQNLLDDYVVYRETETSSRIGTTAVSGDTRITTEYVYGAQTKYRDSSGDLENMATKLFEFALGQTHPYVGTFMSVLGIFIQPKDYTTYTGTIVTSLHDYVIITKKAEVYRNNIWEPMATSQKKNTSAQVNSVYYKGTVRYTPKNLDLGQVSGQAGEFFYDDAKLQSLAKNTLSPLFYSYQFGTIVNVSPYFQY